MNEQRAMRNADQNNPNNDKALLIDLRYMLHVTSYISSFFQSTPLHSTPLRSITLFPTT